MQILHPFVGSVQREKYGFGRRIYSRELKIAAMQEVDSGRTIGEVARQLELSLHLGSIAWRVARSRIKLRRNGELLSLSGVLRTSVRSNRSGLVRQPSI